MGGPPATSPGPEMQSDLDRPPDLESLTQGLAKVLNDTGSGLTILDRAPNPFAGDPFSEVVTCRTADGRIIRVLCKYGHPDRDAGDQGYWGGIAYEAAVYRTVLRPLGVTAPRCYGSYRQRNPDRTWLILEFLHPTIPVSRDPAGEAIFSAADWLGRFHAAAERLPASGAESLRRYDAAYYRGWARRAVDFASAPEISSVRTACRRVAEFASVLLDASLTVIHGEFYPENVLFHEGRVVPIDWETAALAAGEIDLASLVEGWPAVVASGCEQRYSRSRWPSGPPHDLERTLAAARAYWSLRWLGHRAGWLDQEQREGYLQTLRAAAERLRVI
jgi:hypothetical protein